MASPLELPRRLAASVGSSIDAAGQLPVFQQRVLGHLESMDQAMGEHLRSMDGGIQALRELISPVRDDIAALTARSVELERSTRELERRITELQGSVAGDLDGQLAEANDVLKRLEALVARISERVPDPDEPGPIAKARDALTGES